MTCGWTTVAVVVGVALVLWLATWAHLRFWVARLTRPLAYDGQWRIATPDGSAFELRRLQPPHPTTLPPVLLVHGIAINHRNLDPQDDQSLARTLRDLGRDVWLLTLRSGRDDLSWHERHHCSFAALAQQDVPLAVDEVRRRSGASQVDYIGFSMGGMLLYASLGRSLSASWLRRAVIMGSPGRVGRVVPGVGWLRHLPPMWLPGLPLRPLSHLVAFASEWFGTPIHSLIMNLRNARAGSVRLAAVDAVQSIPGPLLHDMLRWAYRDGVVRLDDGLDVLDGLAAVDVPVLFVAATVDRLGPSAALRKAWQAWGRERPAVRKAWLLVGREGGHASDYGHVDLILGPHSPRDVFAPVCQFLAGGETP
jgi:pimeloyl-ACP methyl ester carboxylesterase